jgi:hypothetical protein
MDYISLLENLDVDHQPVWAGGSADQLQFGLEVEFTPRDSFALLKIYEPMVDGLDETSIETWAHTVREEIFGRAHGDHADLLRLRPASQERKGAAVTLWPATAHRDDTGNLELTFPPVKSWSAFRQQVAAVRTQVGDGSYQAMVSMPSEIFFSGGSRVRKPEHLGWLGFFNMLDVFARLQRGYQRYLEDPDREVARTFRHPYLGPMILIRHRRLLKYLEANSRGEMWDDESRVRAARREQSFKYVGSTAYRPDIAGPDRVCFEIRDAHRDAKLLLQRTARVGFYWMNDLQIFATCAGIQPYDSAHVYGGLSPAAQDLLEDLFPSRAPSFVQQFEQPRFVHEVYRQFAFPLREWASLASALTALKDQLRPRLDVEFVSENFVGDVVMAQDSFRTHLEALAATSNGRSDAERSAARNRVQGLLCTFAHESKIFATLTYFEQKIVDYLLPARS